MINHYRNKLLIITAVITYSYCSPVIAAQSDVLEIDEIANADLSTLLDDTKLFNTISMGIALSIAECNGKEICEPTVDEGEIGQLIEALDRRIESVVTRQQNSEEELTSVITAYVDTKEKYADALQRLGEIARPEPPQDEFIVEEDAFSNEDALIEDEYSFFSDIDEEIEDDEEDEDLGALEDDSEDI